MKPLTAVEFSCAGSPVALLPGTTFTREVLHHFSDTAASVLADLTSQIEQGTPWRDLVDRAFGAANPWLHRIICDPRRDLFFREIAPISGQHVLDLGSGWGQQALTLARQNFVCAVEPNPHRLAFVRAVARQTGVETRMFFIQANAQDLAFHTPFDVVTCIGVLEWAGTFVATNDPQSAQVEFLRLIRATLRRGGRCIIGIENRLGLKYLLGARDDHTGVAGVSLLDYQLANRRWRESGHGDLTAITYTKAEYEHLLAAAGFSSSEFYCAYPDYKLPQVILPFARPGEVDAFFLQGGSVAEHDGFDGLPLPAILQEELQSHYRSFAALGIASNFAPSFFIIASA